MLVPILQGLGLLLNRLPNRLVLAMGDAIGLFWFYVLPIRRAVVIQNLKQCFPQASSKKLARKNYRHYGRVLVEMLRSFAWSPETYRSQVQMHGLENLKIFLDEKKGGVLLTCHLGNWEVEIGSAAAFGVPIDLVVKSSRTPWADRLMKWYRTRHGVNVFYETGTAKDILRSISSGRFVGFILDQFMGPPIGLPVKFFGREAGTAAALALIHEKRNFPIIPVHSFRDSKGRLHTEFGKVIQFPSLSSDRNERLHQKTQIFNDVIEEKIRFFPEQWLWLHRRWKGFHGHSKWRMATFLFVSLFLYGCSSPENTSPTGITLPPDREIAVPDLQKEGEVVDPSTSKQSKPVGIDKSVLNAIQGKKTGKEVKKKPDEKKAELIEKKFKLIPVGRLPFEPGEKMIISLRWLMLSAGNVTLKVQKNEDFKGRPTLLLWGNVLSSKLVDTIYHVENTIESIVDREAFMPYKFLLHMNETHQKKETKVLFDHQNGKANYWAQRISEKWGNQNEDRWDELVPQARDMFSALYYARIFNFSLNKLETFYVYENGKNWQIELLPVANELLISKVGAFQCWKIKVTVKLDNVLKPMGDMFLWLSDDSKRYIVKFDAKLKIGSMIGDLIEVSQ